MIVVLLDPERRGGVHDPRQRRPAAVLRPLANAATARSPDLADTVCREATTMRRQIDHHLARARAIGRRSSAQARAPVWASLEAVERAVSRLYEQVTVDLAGDKKAVVRVERQDLDEMLGNLIENAAKYGGGRVFVTVEDRRPIASRSRSRTTAGAFPRRSAKTHLRPRRPARHRQARHRPRPRHRPRRRPDLRRLDPPRGERGFGRPARPAQAAAGGVAVSLAFARHPAHIAARMTATIHSDRRRPRPVARSDDPAGRGRPQPCQRRHPRADAERGRR